MGYAESTLVFFSFQEVYPAGVAGWSLFGGGLDVGDSLADRVGPGGAQGAHGECLFLIRGPLGTVPFSLRLKYKPGLVLTQG